MAALNSKANDVHHMLQMSMPHTLPPVGAFRKPTSPIIPAAEDKPNLQDELRQAKREIELLKSMDPFRAADMALELQMEKMRVVEAESARDSAVQRLASAYDSIKQKALAVTRLETEKEDLERRLLDTEYKLKSAMNMNKTEEHRRLEAEVARLNSVIDRLNGELSLIKCGNNYAPAKETSPTSRPASTGFLKGVPEKLHIITNGLKCLNLDDSSPTRLGTPTGLHSSVPSRQSTSPLRTPDYHQVSNPFDQDMPGHEEMLQVRNSFLASLPIPVGVPDDSLVPIVLPPSMSLHEFLTDVSGPLRVEVAGYRVFQENMTHWCPEREEHGFFLTPLYRCVTNSRVITAHRWIEVDPRGKMIKPTECFYNREGKWYYAGQYIAIRLEDLNQKEWEALDADVSASLVKETLAGRKNTSPQNHYETGQLYSIGALKVACVGLQCVGFNSMLYHGLLEQAGRVTHGGRFQSDWGSFGSSSDVTAVASESDSLHSLASGL